MDILPVSLREGLPVQRRAGHEGDPVAHVPDSYTEPDEGRRVRSPGRELEDLTGRRCGVGDVRAKKVTPRARSASETTTVLSAPATKLATRNSSKSIAVSGAWLVLTSSEVHAEVTVKEVPWRCRVAL